MDNPQAKAVSNWEEILPLLSFESAHGKAGLHELPLVAFTLLLQMAAGLAVFSLRLSPIPSPVLLAIGVLIGVGGLISFLHLGRKRNAWRAAFHLKKSWLSREILVAGLFIAAWAMTAGLQWIWKTAASPWPMAILGVVLIYSMSQVYLLRAVPAWNSWRTNTSFFLSATVLGVLGMMLADPYPTWLIVGGFAMAAEAGLMLTAQSAVFDKASKLRFALLGLGISGTLIAVILPQASVPWLSVPLFIFALTAEVIGRWQFYTKRLPFPKTAK